MALKADRCRFYSLPGRKVLGFSHHVVLRPRERDMRRCEFIILLGGARGDAHRAIINEDTKRKITAILPLQAPFGSHQRPAPIAAGPEAKSLADLP
jgi:hypothetical protein